MTKLFGATALDSFRQSVRLSCFCRSASSRCRWASCCCCLCASCRWSSASCWWRNASCCARCWDKEAWHREFYSNDAKRFQHAVRKIKHSAAVPPIPITREALHDTYQRLSCSAANAVQTICVRTKLTCSIHSINLCSNETAPAIRMVCISDTGQ